MGLSDIEAAKYKQDAIIGIVGSTSGAIAETRKVWAVDSAKQLVYNPGTDLSIPSGRFELMAKNGLATRLLEPLAYSSQLKHVDVAAGVFSLPLLGHIIRSGVYEFHQETGELEGPEGAKSLDVMIQPLETGDNFFFLGTTKRVDETFDFWSERLGYLVGDGLSELGQLSQGILYADVGPEHQHISKVIELKEMSLFAVHSLRDKLHTSGTGAELSLLTMMTEGEAAARNQWQNWLGSKLHDEYIPTWTDVLSDIEEIRDYHS